MLSDIDLLQRSLRAAKHQLVAFSGDSRGSLKDMSQEVQQLVGELESHTAAAAGRRPALPADQQNE